MPAKVPVIFFERRTVLAVILYVLVVALITVTVYFRNRGTIYQQLDQRLAASAAGIQYVLADTFHDRATSKDSILPAEDQQNIRLLTDLARQSGLSYLYTVRSCKIITWLFSLQRERLNSSTRHETRHAKYVWPRILHLLP